MRPTGNEYLCPLCKTWTAAIKYGKEDALNISKLFIKTSHCAS